MPSRAGSASCPSASTSACVMDRVASSSSTTRIRVWETSLRLVSFARSGHRRLGRVREARRQASLNRRDLDARAARRFAAPRVERPLPRIVDQFGAGPRTTDDAPSMAALPFMVWATRSTTSAIAPLDGLPERRQLHGRILQENLDDVGGRARRGVGRRPRPRAPAPGASAPRRPAGPGRSARAALLRSAGSC